MLFDIDPDVGDWVVRNPITGQVHFSAPDWTTCDEWITEHSDVRYVVLERRADYLPFDEYVSRGLLRNAPVKAKPVGDQMMMEGMER